MNDRINRLKSSKDARGLDANAANPDERMDGYNGLALSPNLDRAFDQGLITFDETGTICISPSLAAEARQALGIDGRMKLRYSVPALDAYLTYHRELVFRQ